MGPIEAKILKAVLGVQKEGAWYFAPREGKAIRQADNMISKQGLDCQPEDVIAVMGRALFGSGKNGFLITRKGMYNCMDEQPSFIAFADLKKAEVRNDCVHLSLQNGKTIDWHCLKNSGYIAEVFTQILQALTEKTDGKDAQSWFDYAMDLYEGAGVPEDLTEALTAMEHAARLGVPQAMFNCYVMYSQGQGTAKDEAKAMDWCHKAAEKGNVGAQFCLFIAYYYGEEGCAKDQAVGLYWLEKAAEGGHAGACKAMGSLYSKHKSVPEALYWYEKAAKLGDSDAMMKCFELCSTDGTVKDPKKAYHWIKKALELRQPTAIDRLKIAKAYLKQLFSSDTM